MNALPQQSTIASTGSNVISPPVLQQQQQQSMVLTPNTISNAISKGASGGVISSSNTLSPPSVLTPINGTTFSSNVSPLAATTNSNAAIGVASQHNQASYSKVPPPGGVKTTLPLIQVSSKTFTTMKATSPPNSGRKRKNSSPTTNTCSPSNAAKAMVNTTTNPVLPLSSTSAVAIAGNGAGHAVQNTMNHTTNASAGAIRPPSTTYPSVAASSSYQQAGTTQKYQFATALVPAPSNAAQQQQQQPAGDEEQTDPPKPQLTEKKLRRLEKNRLSARECRRRKREAAETMLHEINILEAENVQLRLQLQIGQEAETSVNEEQHKLTQEIGNLLQSGEASEADIYSTLEEFKEKYADYGHSRRSSIEFHLRNVARLLMPTQTTSVVMHAISSSNNLSSLMDINTGTSTSTNLNSNNDNTKSTGAATAGSVPQPSQFIQPATSVPVAATESLPIENAMTALSKSTNASSTLVEQLPSAAATEAVPNATTKIAATQQQPSFDPKKLFLFLAKYLNVTPDQATALKDSRFVAQEMDSCLEEAFKVLSELRDRLTKTGNDLETEFNNVRSILTPTQAAKFLVWVANNAACMHMLNELWDRVYPST
jgi:bZIP transcription factor